MVSNHKSGRRMHASNWKAGLGGSRGTSGGGGNENCIEAPWVQNTNPGAQSLSSANYDSYLYDACLLPFMLDTSECWQCSTSICNLGKQCGGVAKNSRGPKRSWRSTPDFTGRTSAESKEESRTSHWQTWGSSPARSRLMCGNCLRASAELLNFSPAPR